MTLQDTLFRLHITPELDGYRYIREAVNLVQTEPEYLRHLTKRLYPDVAKAYSTTSNRVERCMRHAIEKAIDQTDPGEFTQLVGIEPNKYSGGVTNGAFIGVLAERFRSDAT